MNLIYLITLFLSLGVFNSCSETFFSKDSLPQVVEINQPREKIKDNVYGTYLAGRVAHIRQNYDLAADYYIKSINLGTEGKDILSSVYLLLASEGRIDEASDYALKAFDAGDKNNLIQLILMAENVKKNRFEEAYQNTQNVQNKPFQENIIPIFQAWILAGQDKKEEALKTLDSIKKEKGLVFLYHIHHGLICDYFGDSDSAFKDFEFIINDERLPLSFRSLQLIGNFYIRNGQKDKSLQVSKKYYEQNAFAPMLKALHESFENAVPDHTEKLIDTPQKGMAEAVFNVGTMFRGYQNEVAQLLTSLVLDLNENLEVARISMGDILEQNRRYDKAIEEYSKIDKSSPVFYVAQLKIVENYAIKDDKQKAFETLQKLLKYYPDNTHILFRLGEISRVMGKYDSAIEYYQKSLEKIPETDINKWTIYYALGIAYERQNNWEKAEEAFKKALELSHRHPFVLNFLGYAWLERGINYNEALFMIFEAHRKNSEDGHIIDSLGWALYKMGNFENAVKVLERASEYLPSNAVIYDHLGDAYWQVGRKAEARFQWNHALQAKDDLEELDQEVIKSKIENGIEKSTPILFNEQLLMDRLKAF